MPRFSTLLFILSIILSSCATDIEVNTPALQATLNQELFRAELKNAVLHEDGSIVISGVFDQESLSFSTTSSKMGIHKISKTSNAKACYKSYNNDFFRENRDTAGEIEITEILNNTISGRFHFTNLKDENGNQKQINNGWFYKLPIENYKNPEPTSNFDPENPCLLNATLLSAINGAPMQTNTHTASTFGLDGSSLLLTAANATESITLVFPTDVEVGQYSLTGSGNYSATYSLNNDKSSALSGQLTITEHDIDAQCIQGSFEFLTRSGVMVEQGSFSFGY